MKISSKTESIEITFGPNDQFEVCSQKIDKEKELPFLAAGSTGHGDTKLVIYLTDINLFNLKQKIEDYLFRKRDKQN